MSDVLGRLLVTLDLDAGEFHGKLAGAREGLSGFVSGAGGMLSSFVGGVVGGALTNIAEHAAGALKDFVVQGAEMADTMGKLAQRTGIPVADMSRLAYAADLADVSTGQLTVGLKSLAKGMDEAASGGNSKAAQALRAMGISAVDASGHLRPTADVLREVADKFKGYEDGAGKASLAMALFGRTGDNLIPMLNQGSAGIAEAGKELDAFGGTITPQAAAAGEVFNDNLKRLSWAGKGFALDLASQLTPALGALTDSLISSAKEGGVLHGVALILAGAVKVLLAGVFVLGGAFEFVGKVIAGVAASIALLVQGEFREAGRTVLAAGEDIASGIAGTAKRIAAMYDDAGNAIAAKSDATAEKVAAPFVASGKKVKEHADKAAKEIEHARNSLQTALGRLDVETAKKEAAPGHEEEAKITARLDTGDLAKSLGKLDSAEAAKWRAELIEHARALDEEKTKAAAAKKETEEWQKAMREGETLTKNTKSSLDSYNQEVARLDDLYRRGVITLETHDLAVKKATESYRKAAIENDTFLKALDGAWKKFRSGFEDSIVDAMTGKFKGGLREMLDAWGQMIAQMIARAIAANFVNSLFQGFGGGNSPVGALVSGTRAEGGGVDRGRAYLVGERGPELFVPNASGSVVPNDAIAAKSPSGELTVRIPDLDRLGRLSLRDVVEGYISDVAATRGTA